MSINKLSDIYRRNLRCKYNTTLSNYMNNIRYMLTRNINKSLILNFDIVRAPYQLLSTILYISDEEHGCEEGMDRHVHIEYEDYNVSGFDVNSNILSDWKGNIRHFPISIFRKV